MLSDLLLQEIFALDRIQKKLPIDDVVAKHLRRSKLIEGRKLKPSKTSKETLFLNVDIYGMLSKSGTFS